MLDIGPCEVRGAMRASRARVMYDPSTGTLYVVQNVDKVRKFTTAAPVLSQDKYKAIGPDAEVSFFRRGCTCSYALKRHNPTMLMEKAK
jgi:hypothetical protein